ncbi:hypothetical protein [Paenibacillus ferrarius]|uniref:hypothetical protein n=1 Tax=Paenibacillus ferrarius TaxID=1469647 RepID=UPI003D2A707E
MSENDLQFMNDDATSQRLVEISRSHCKLALEHSGINTHPTRREAIRAEIERLRMERESVLISFQLNKF